MHARMKPVEHRFTYKMSSILIDLDRLEEAGNASILFSVNRPNVVNFSEASFGPKDGSPLRPYIDKLLGEVNVDRPEHVFLLCYPKVLGNGFNPLAVYYCLDEKDRLTALVYEVRNTFGETHTYVEPVYPEQTSKAGVRQTTPKQFYVSPFMDMEMRYHFRLREPGDTLAVRILETDRDGPILSATFAGEYREAKTSSLLMTLLQTAGLTWKVVAGIHFEALRLWLKGLRIRPRKPHTLSHSYPEAGSKQAENKA